MNLLSMIASATSICLVKLCQAPQITVFFYVLFFKKIFQSSLEPHGTGRTLSVVFLSDFNELKKLVGKFCGIFKKIYDKLSE